MPICANCGQDNPEGFQFCGRCAASLKEADRTAEERKVVSVLFCDLVGFTARSERADPEDVRSRLRTYHDRLRTEIERLGGTVEKFIGDAVMAVFGAPVAHEDDAERAVRAGLRITEAIDELNEAHPGLELSVRIGINTGEAVVTLGARPDRGEGMVAGDVVNTAARLQAAAPTGSVVVGGLTERITRDHIEYEELPPVEVKGKAEPVHLWRALSARGRYGVDVEQRTRSPFIGRDHEVELLHRTFTRCVDESSLQLVTITGEPGVGKTRLLWEFKSRVDDDPTMVAYWRQGRCLPYGDGVTFWALGEIVKGLAGVLESDAAEEASEKIDVSLRAFVEDESEHEWLRARLHPLIGLGAPEGSQETDREEAYAAWRRFLESVAARYPLVLIFEDLHWADPALVGFVDHLVDWSSGVPMLVICSARPELYERHPGWGGGKRNSATMSLAPLTDEETARLLAALLEQALLPAELQATLLDRAGGNPLYAEEFVRMLLDRGGLEVRGRAIRLVDGTKIELPETIQALISARLDTLSAGRKSLLQDASVVGKVFWSGAVAFMAGQEDRAVREGLHELGRKELVRPMRSSSVKDQAEYAFWHALVRDVAYAQIPRADRARRHRLAAQWIERMAGERVADHAELLAHHYEQALELSRAAGDLEGAEEIERSLLRFLVMAADRAQHLDVGTAWALYRRALELTAEDDPERPGLLVKAMYAADATGEVPGEEVEAGYQAAIDHYRRLGDWVRAGDAMRKLAIRLRVRGMTEQGRTLAEEAVRLLEQEAEGRELAEAYVAMAGVDMMADRSDSSLAWAEKALSLAKRLEIPAVAARGLQFRGIAFATRGDRKGLDDMAEALRMSLEMGIGTEANPGYINLADWTSIYGDPAKGLEIYQQGIEYAARHGAIRPTIWAKAEITWRLFDMGRWDELLELADEIAQWEQLHGEGQPGVISTIERAHVQTYRGRLEEATKLEASYLPRAREIRDPQVYWQALLVGGVLRMARGDLSGAREMSDELWLATEGSTMRSYQFPEALRVMIGTGDLEGAWRRAEEDIPPIPGLVIRRLAGRAAVTEAEGDLESALSLYEESGEEWAARGHVFEHANSLLGAGRCMLAMGRAALASARLTEARATFGSLGAEPLVRETDELLARATARTS